MKPLLIDHETRPIRVDPPLVLAPLAGHTDRAFRALVKRLGGCGLVVTEMVSSEGLTRGSKASREIASVTEGERPVGVQLFGTDPQRLADSAVIVEELGANLVDVNMGCPVPKVTRLGAGAALMCDIGRVTRLISEMVKSAGIPVTAKIRSGWDPESINAREVALALEQAGAAAITVHPRCRSERHRGRAAWQVIRDVKEAVRVPVIGNGDVRSAEDAKAMIAETGADGIMIGRGALENPWVFRQIRDELAGAHHWEPTTSDYREAIAFFIESLAEYLPEKLVVNRVKALAGWISKGLPGGGALRGNVYASKSLRELRNVFETHFDATHSSI
ncbi:MAG: tRNA dihydrouridine synthase DusB [Vicinamibacteria bacterium]